jgi:hypothetical protein
MTKRARIDLIPHGIPRRTLRGLGLLQGPVRRGREKGLADVRDPVAEQGIEHVLHALPDIVAEFPDVVYVVLGATHPHELRTRGEAYRLGLEAIARQNNLRITSSFTTVL